MCGNTIGVPGFTSLRSVVSAIAGGFTRARWRLGSNLRFSSGFPSGTNIGVPGFEPGTSATRTQRSTGLSHTPDYSGTDNGRGGIELRRFTPCSSPLRSESSPPRSPLRGLRGFERAAA